MLRIDIKTIYKEVCDIYGHNEMSYSQVTRWISRFKSGRESLEDDPRPGRPRTTVNKSNTGRIQKLLTAVSRYTIRELARRTGLNLHRIHVIIRKIMGLKGICT